MMTGAQRGLVKDVQCRQPRPRAHCRRGWIVNVNREGVQSWLRCIERGHVRSGRTLLLFNNISTTLEDREEWWWTLSCEFEMAMLEGTTDVFYGENVEADMEVAAPDIVVLRAILLSEMVENNYEPLEVEEALYAMEARL